MYQSVTKGPYKVVINEAVEFDVNLVPHTLSVTTLGGLIKGQGVHIEVDVVARYLKRLQDCS